MCNLRATLAPHTGRTGATGPSAPGEPEGTYPDCVPPDPLSRGAYVYTSSHLHPVILNHSLRVYLFARNLAIRELTPISPPLLFVACLYHDMGTAEPHDGAQRFEVEGADAAVEYLQSHSHSHSHDSDDDDAITDEQIHDVWVAIACHTSAGIAERISPLARLVRLGVLMDFKKGSALALTEAGEVEEHEAALERGEIEMILSVAVVEQALRRPGEEQIVKAPPASWPGVLVRSKLENPGWEGINKAF
ncbi:hypothetical protein BAUCODRAFT_148854 [Baudoinia panamericana UAMH 10762]|uniref:HD/PDEase domain-containing protein n=1 Tax=Baudoinia panamericana (strain UAMH 10762) TaxID=717646 RepID=M2MHF0_BAUPA|nr:uncharacterized protein BAUCODRAFT_148854 [Baudoinia panamericana UAMH 10762]EMC96016.1 hypothetical protein BAUCODRAFT_148854 [Baudoinia panamericana UAMH 10762]